MLKGSRPTMYRIMNDADISRSYTEIGEATLDNSPKLRVSI